MSNIQLIVGELSYFVPVDRVKAFPDSYFGLALNDAEVLELKIESKNVTLFKYIVDYMIYGCIPHSRKGRCLFNQNILTELREKALLYGLASLVIEIDEILQENHSSKQSMDGQSTSIVYSLPPQLLLELLGEWLTLSQVTALDSAICNHESRPYFLDQLSLIRSCDFDGSCPEYGNGNRSYYEWLYARNIIIKDMFLSDSCFSRSGNFISPYHKLNYKHVTSLAIMCKDDIDVPYEELLSSFKSVTSLTCAVNYGSDLVLDSIVNMSEIKVLELLDPIEEGYDDDYSLDILVDKCRNLESLKVDYGYRFEDDDQYSVLFTNNPNLKVLRTPSITLPLMTQYCSNLEDVDLFCDMAYEGESDIVLTTSKIKSFKCSDLDYNNNDGIKEIRVYGLIAQAEVNYDGFLQHCSGFNKITYYSCNDTFNIFKLIFNSASTLQYLSIASKTINRNELRDMMSSCLLLESITFMSCVVEFESVFKSYPPQRLKHLFVDSNLQNPLMNISDAIEAIYSCPSLTSFEMKFANKPAKKDLERLKQYAKSHNVKGTIGVYGSKWSFKTDTLT